MPKYDWVRAKLYGDLDAQTAGEHIESLVEKYQEHLTAEEILADARHSHSPLHKAFEWNDSDAAERHRRSTAKMIVQSLVIKQKVKGERRATRAFVFVKVPKHGRKCYMPVRSAMAQPELKEQVINQALKRLESWIGMYGSSRALREVTKDVERLRRRIEVEYLTAAGIV